MATTHQQLESSSSSLKPCYTSEFGFKQMADYFKLIGDATRLRILAILRDGEQSVSSLAQKCNTSASNISGHLALLSRFGLVVKRNQATTVFYRLVESTVFSVVEMGYDLTVAQANARLKALTDHTLGE